MMLLSRQEFAKEARSQREKLFSGLGVVGCRC